MDINMFYSWSVGFHTELKPSLQITDSLVPKVFLGKNDPPHRELLSNFIEIKEPILLDAGYFSTSTLFGWFYNTLSVLATLSPLV